MKFIQRIILVNTIILTSCISETSSPNKFLQNNQKVREVRSLLKPVLNLIDSAKFVEANNLLDSLRPIAERNRDTLLLSGILNDYGLIHFRSGDANQSITFYKESLVLDRLIMDSTQIGIKLKNIGISYRQGADHQQALTYFLKALPYIKNRENKVEEASINNSIGNIYNDLDEFSKGYDFLTRSQNTWSELQDSVRNSKALGNIGNSLLGMNRIEEAIIFYNKALAIKEVSGTKISIAITLNNLGEAFIKQHRYTKAQHYLLRSIKLREEAGQRSGIAIVANNMADLETRRERFGEAQDWLNQAMQIIEKTKASDRQLENLRLQRELFAKTGKYKKAYEIDILYDEMTKTAFNDQVVKVKDRQYEYDLDQEEKAKELAESRLEVFEANTKVQQFRSQVQRYIILVAALAITLIGYFAYNLRKKNRHIENLIRELHHRVKNHLGMISGMFGAQTEGGSISNADLLEEAKTRVEAVNGIHRRLYRQDEYEFVNMQEYLTELVDNSALVFGLFNKIEKQLEIQSEPLEIDKAISVGLIANEVLTNAFRYGLQTTDQPMLKIVLEKALKGYRMIIFNNAKPNQQPITESTGFGKELIKRLTDNLKGQSHTTQQNGFHFELTFP